VSDHSLSGWRSGATASLFLCVDSQVTLRGGWRRKMPRRYQAKWMNAARKSGTRRWRGKTYRAATRFSFSLLPQPCLPCHLAFRARLPICAHTAALLRERAGTKHIDFPAVL